MPVALACVLAASLGITDRPATQPSLKYAEGGIARGDVTSKRMAIVFTGGDYAEGVPEILRVCEAKKLQTAFFVTGDFLRAHPDAAKQIVDAGHLLGPHSDRHLLYCDWGDRSKNLVTEAEFKADLQKNMDDLAALGSTASVFIPPYEWFNSTHVEWARDLGLTLVNFTPGSGSNRDYIPESDPKFQSSQALLDRILQFEATEAHGLNGFILLLHAGSQRKDKMHDRFGDLVDALQHRGYEIVGIESLIGLPQSALPQRGTTAPASPKP